MSILQVKKYYQFMHSPLGKVFEKHIKAIEDQGVNQIEALKALKPKGQKEDIKSIEDISKRDEN